nr:ecotropic viral integration site 5 ortholog [Misgurnus anguillicaudatus]
MSVEADKDEEGDSGPGVVILETNRFGFIVGNGETDSDAPCPELVRHRETKWLGLIKQWEQVMEKKNNKVKGQCQKGIPASVRAKCWPLLCGAMDRKKQNEKLYEGLIEAPDHQGWTDIIKRDTDRQFPFHEMFQSKDGHGQKDLLQVLKAYTQYKPDEGYCQAQGPVAAVLLMNMPAEEAFWCLAQISEHYLPGYYSPLLEGVLFDAAVLSNVLKKLCPAAHKHLQNQGVEPLMFATDWLMCLYSRHLPFNTLLRVWDLFFCYGVRVLFQVAVVLVRRCLGEGRHRKECDGQMETLERLRGVKQRVQNDQTDAFIHEVCSVALSSADLLKQTEKEMEKWKKERPGSTFDPRGRCHGYRMAWERVQNKQKENEKKEKQKGSLTLPLMRSHSSLSPHILRKKFRKRGSRSDAEEWDGGGRKVSQSMMEESDDGEIRRRSVCGVAGEQRAKQDRLAEFNTNKQKDHSTHVNITFEGDVFEEGHEETACMSHVQSVTERDSRQGDAHKDNHQENIERSLNQQKYNSPAGQEKCDSERTGGEESKETHHHEQNVERQTCKDEQISESETCQDRQISESETCQDRQISESGTCQERHKSESETFQNESRSESETCKDETKSESETCQDGQKVESETSQERQKLESETCQDETRSESETCQDGQKVESETRQDGPKVVSETSEERQKSESDTCQDGQKSESETCQDGQKLVSETCQDETRSESETCQDGQKAESETCQDGQKVESETSEERQKSENETCQDGQNVESETCQDGQKAESETCQDGQNVESETSEEKLKLESETCQDETRSESETCQDETRSESETSEDRQKSESETSEERQKSESETSEERQKLESETCQDETRSESETSEERQKSESEANQKDEQNIEEQGDQDKQNVEIQIISGSYDPQEEHLQTNSGKQEEEMQSESNSQRGEIQTGGCKRNKDEIDALQKVITAEDNHKDEEIIQTQETPLVTEEQTHVDQEHLRFHLHGGQHEENIQSERREEHKETGAQQDVFSDVGIKEDDDKESEKNRETSQDERDGEDHKADKMMQTSEAMLTSSTDPESEGESQFHPDGSVTHPVQPSDTDHNDLDIIVTSSESEHTQMDTKEAEITLGATRGDNIPNSQGEDETAPSINSGDGDMDIADVATKNNETSKPSTKESSHLENKRRGRFLFFRQPRKQ